MSHATIRYWAAARDAAGVDEEQHEAGDLATLLDSARARHADPRFERVLSYCSFLIDGTPAGSRPPETIELAEGATVEVLPPFAGG